MNEVSISDQRFSTQIESTQTCLVYHHNLLVSLFSVVACNPGVLSCALRTILVQIGIRGLDALIPSLSAETPLSSASLTRGATFLLQSRQ